MSHQNKPPTTPRQAVPWWQDPERRAKHNADAIANPQGPNPPGAPKLKCYYDSRGNPRTGYNPTDPGDRPSKPDNPEPAPLPAGAIRRYPRRRRVSE
jgi:hypothetical protein